MPRRSAGRGTHPTGAKRRLNLTTYEEPRNKDTRANIDCFWVNGYIDYYVARAGHIYNYQLSSGITDDIDYFCAREDEKNPEKCGRKYRL